MAHSSIPEEKFIPVREGTSLKDYGKTAGNLLVIAPHPDDEALGAGGSMIEASTQGRGVFAVYLTDGRGSPRRDPTLGDEQMASLRMQEAMASLKVMGAVGGFFLKARSEDLKGERGKVIQRDLGQIVEWIRPQEVILPAPYERHLTHQSSTLLSIEALRAAAFQPAALLAYSLWGSFWGVKKRVIRDISPFIQKKVEAVLAHKSQIEYKNYQQGILGKNNYEAIFWESHELQKAAFVEIFLDLTEMLEKRGLTLEQFIRQDVEGFIAKFLPG